MSDRAVSIISTYNDAKEQLLNKIPVAFIVYDPNASTDDDEDTIDASGATADEKMNEKLIQSKVSFSNE